MTSPFDTLAPQRQSSFRFDLLDASGQPIGIVEPDQARPPTIDMDIARPVKRAMRGVVLPPTDANAINPVTDRIRPVMVHDGVDYPMGVFMFVDGSEVERSYGSTFGGSMVDQMQVLNQPQPLTRSYQTGTNITAALTALFTEVGVPANQFVIDDTAAVVGAPIGWRISTSYLVTANALAQLAGCYQCYRDNQGVLRVQAAQDFNTVAPIATYVSGADSNIVDGSVVRPNRAIGAPNRYIVVDSGANDAPIFGIYDVPDSAPQSYANIGYRRSETITIQGLPDILAAEAVAYAAAQQDARDSDWLSFAGIINPLHDTYQAVQALGTLYREQAWATAVAEGAAMSHSLRKVWAQA